MKLLERWGLLVCLVGLGCLCTNARTRADSVDLNAATFAPGSQDGFHLSRPSVLSAREVGLNLPVSYANDELLLRRIAASGATTTSSVVGHHLVAHPSVSVSAWEQAMFYASLDVHLLMRGDTLPAGAPFSRADGSGLGDLRLGARIMLMQFPKDLGAIALQLSGGLPVARWTDGSQHYSGETSVYAEPSVLIELRGAGLRVALNLGGYLRKKSHVGDVTLGSELAYALGLYAPLATSRLELATEILGRSSFLQRSASFDTTRIEGLVGLMLQMVPAWSAGAAVGTGFTQGLGSPDVRATLRVTYRSRPPLHTPVIEDDDADGVPNERDQCPLTPEDLDGTDDADGCPEYDDDLDGVPDDRDRCPTRAEDIDGIDDDDGCPEVSEP